MCIEEGESSSRTSHYGMKGKKCKSEVFCTTQGINMSFSLSWCRTCSQSSLSFTLKTLSPNYKNNIYSVSKTRLIWGMFQGPQWIPEKLRIVPNPMYTVLSYRYIPMIKFNLQMKHIKRLTKITDNEIKQI